MMMMMMMSFFCHFAFSANFWCMTLMTFEMMLFGINPASLPKYKHSSGKSGKFQSCDQQKGLGLEKRAPGFFSSPLSWGIGKSSASGSAWCCPNPFGGLGPVACLACFNTMYEAIHNTSFGWFNPSQPIFSWWITSVSTYQNITKNRITKCQTFRWKGISWVYLLIYHQLPLSRCLDISPSNVSFSLNSADLSREWSGVCFNHYLMEKATF